ncbi:hypothetical protein POM88_021275 [Heracleum sosnowskyi]|uniref:RPN1 N-terminal domain-containing protein n=1 Tax=Heracleum sosnowskyi TaxID=360622 RepID=A0AAD8ID94_9APIA|nr:hypothetical protein POM88_021275 [Heracleum sosnowskyi]
MHLFSGKSAGHTGLSTRGGHLIRPTSPKSPSASAFESIEGSDDEDNMTDNSKVDSTYLYTNGDANLPDNGTVNGEPNIAASSMIRSYSVSGDLHDPVAADILRKEPEHETFREEDTIDDLIDLVKQIVAFHMQHNAEPEVVDLLMEVKHLNLLKKHVDKASYKRTCLYLSSSAKYLPEPEDLQVIDIGYMTYMKFKDYPRALQIALFRDNMQKPYVLPYSLGKIFQKIELVRSWGLPEVEEICSLNLSRVQSYLGNVIHLFMLLVGNSVLVLDSLPRPKMEPPVFEIFVTTGLQGHMYKAKGSLSPFFGVFRTHATRTGRLSLVVLAIEITDYNTHRSFCAQLVANVQAATVEKNKQRAIVGDGALEVKPRAVGAVPKLGEGGFGSVYKVIMRAYISLVWLCQKHLTSPTQ